MFKIEKRPIQDAVDDGLIFVQEVDGKHPQIIQSPKVEGEEPVYEGDTPHYPSGDDWQTVWYPIYVVDDKTLFVEKGDHSIDADGAHHFKDGLTVNWLP